MRSKQDIAWARAGATEGHGSDQRGDVASIFRTSLLSLLVGGSGIALIGAIAGDRKALIGAATASLVTLGLLWALRRGHTRLAMIGAVSMLLLIVSIEVCVGDGIHDVGVSLFTVVALVSALLLDRRSSLAFAGLAVLSVALIGVAELAGWLVTPLSHAVVPGELAILVFLLGTFAVLIRSVTRALYKSLDDAALNEQTYREIFNATSDGIFVHDVETGRIIDVNDAACAISGFTRQELIGKSLRDLPGPDGEPADVATAEQLLQRASEGAHLTFEWKAARKDGSTVWIEVALRTAQIRGKPRVLAATRDISDRKANAEQLRAAERLNAIGQLAGGVAHDFNNQLTAILAHANLLRDKLPGDDAARASAEAILQCSHRSADLTRQLLAFARKGGRHDEVIEVDALVREVTSLLERSIDRRVALELDLAAGGAGRVLGDASFLGSALLNLGLNGRDAMPEGGVLRFETRRLHERELPEAARVQLPALERQYVRVRVRDSGVGIGKAALARIFEPFFTTKPQGTGLGLSAAYGTVHAHRGAIVVDSVEGAGSTFDVYLPATEQLPSRQPAQRPGEPPPRLRVLLAEDEPAVGRATELLLAELGCQVTWCRDGREALSVFERDVTAFDLLMLDHTMPHLLGSEVAAKAAALRPQLPIISTSGFDDTPVPIAASDQRIFLPKPFDADLLRAALARAVGRSV